MKNMRRIGRITILCLALLAGAAPTAAVSAGINSWTGLGLAGKVVTTIATWHVYSHTLWVGTESGLYTNAGGSWIPLNYYYTYSFAFRQTAPHDMYQGVGTGIVKSTDGGGIWVDVNTGLPSQPALSLAVHPTNHLIVYAGLINSGVYKTTDGGAHWNAVNNGLTELTVTSLTMDPANPAVIYGGTTGDLFKTVDGGANWTDVSDSGTPSYITAVAVDPVSPNNVYVGTGGDLGPVYKSIDGGASWVCIDVVGLKRVQALTVDPEAPGTVYAATHSNGVYKSTNGGQDWSQLHPGMLTNVTALALDPVYPYDVYAGTENGVFDLEQTPGALQKTSPPNGSYTTNPLVLNWTPGSEADEYQYCLDTVNNSACDDSWSSAGKLDFIILLGLAENTTYYWQVRSVNNNGTVYANGGAWWSFTLRHQTFDDVPVSHPLWQYIEAFYDAGITGGCGTSPLIFCPNNPVTRAGMAVFLLRAKYGAAYTPPPTSHLFSDLPVAGKEWQESWVGQFYLEGITAGCGVDPLRYCPENPVTRAAMAVFILRTLEGSSYTPPPASHFFADMPVAGKEWMEPWVDEVYRREITTGCGTGPLIYCPENPVKRQGMAAFIVRAFGLPLP